MKFEPKYHFREEVLAKQQLVLSSNRLPADLNGLSKVGGQPKMPRSSDVHYLIVTVITLAAIFATIISLGIILYTVSGPAPAGKGGEIHDSNKHDNVVTAWREPLH